MRSSSKTPEGPSRSRVASAISSKMDAEVICPDLEFDRPISTRSQSMPNRSEFALWSWSKVSTMLMTHVLAELYGCNVVIEDAAALAEVAKRAAQSVGATIVGETGIRYVPHGLTV